MVNVLALPVLEIENLISKKFSPIYQQILGKDIFPRGLNFACVRNKALRLVEFPNPRAGRLDQEGGLEGLMVSMLNALSLVME